MKSVTYWYQFFTAREELYDVKFTKCEIYGSTLPLAFFCDCTSPACVGPGRKPQDRFSHNEAHIVKLGFTGVFFFLFLLQNIDCG